jgi:hypothetical protein
MSAERFTGGDPTTWLEPVPEEHYRKADAHPNG